MLCQPRCAGQPDCQPGRARDPVQPQPRTRVHAQSGQSGGRPTAGRALLIVAGRPTGPITWVENGGAVPYTFRWGSCSKPPGTRTPLPFLRAQTHAQPQTFAVEGRSGSLSHDDAGALPEPA